MPAKAKGCFDYPADRVVLLSFIYTT